MLKLFLLHQNRVKKTSLNWFCECRTTQNQRKKMYLILNMVCCVLISCAFTPQAARASTWPKVIHFQREPARAARRVLDDENVEES